VDDDRSLRRPVVVTGGAPVPERLIRAFLERGVTLVQGYGLSEAGPLALLLDQRAALERVGSAGKPPLFVDVRVVRPDGSDAGVDQTGELLVRGPNVIAGYWRLPVETRRMLVDGWLHTGDAARLDGDGFAWIVGRVRDAFLVHGQTIHPGDVERALTAHPDVTDAGEDGRALGVGRQTQERGDARRVLHVEQGGAMGASAVPYHPFEEELAERPELVEAGSGTLDHA
jgi:fatty-acyl-CoA synthase